MWVMGIPRFLMAVMGEEAAIDGECDAQSPSLDMGTHPTRVHTC